MGSFGLNSPGSVYSPMVLCYEDSYEPVSSKKVQNLSG